MQRELVRSGTPLQRARKRPPERQWLQRASPHTVLLRRGRLRVVWLSDLELLPVRSLGLR